MQVHGCVARVARQCRTVVVIPAVPLTVVHTQAVHHEKNLAAGSGQRGGKGLVFQRQRPATETQSHRNGQRVGGGGEIVAQHTVDGARHRVCLRLREGPFHVPGQQIQGAIQRRAGNLIYQPSAVIDKASDIVRESTRALAE